MMQIGDLASRAGVTPRTIRYYEEIGIIAPDERTAGGFRLYSENQLRRLNIVQGLKMLGFDLDRIRELFAIKADCKTGGMLAGELVNHIRDQQTEIDNKLQYYAEMKERNAQAIEVLLAEHHPSRPVDLGKIAHRERTLGNVDHHEHHGMAAARRPHAVGTHG